MQLLLLSMLYFISPYWFWVLCYLLWVVISLRLLNSFSGDYVSSLNYFRYGLSLCYDALIIMYIFKLPRKLLWCCFWIMETLLSQKTYKKWCQNCGVFLLFEFMFCLFLIFVFVVYFYSFQCFKLLDGVYDVTANICYWFCFLCGSYFLVFHCFCFTVFCTCDLLSLIPLFQTSGCCCGDILLYMLLLIC